MTALDDLDVSWHEAAHVVVGVSLGLCLRKAALTPEGPLLGYAWFTSHGSKIAHATMFAAGVAWDRSIGQSSKEDATLCRELVKNEADLRTCVRVAGLILSASQPVQRSVALALFGKRSLNARDIAAIARGERITDHE